MTKLFTAKEEKTSLGVAFLDVTKKIYQIILIKSGCADPITLENPTSVVDPPDSPNGLRCISTDGFSNLSPDDQRCFLLAILYCKRSIHLLLSLPRLDFEHNKVPNKGFELHFANLRHSALARTCLVKILSVK